MAMLVDPTNAVKRGRCPKVLGPAEPGHTQILISVLP